MKRFFRKILKPFMMIIAIFAFQMLLFTYSNANEKILSSPSVFITTEKGGPLSDIEISVERFENGEWISICVLMPAENGVVVYEIEDKDSLNSFYRFVHNSKLQESKPTSVIYAYVTSSGDVSYSKHFNDDTCTLGDGASTKIKTLRIIDKQ